MEELSEHLAEAASEADEAADSNERILSDTRFRTLDRLQVTIEAGRRAAPEVYAAMEAHGAALEAGDQEAAAEAAESYFRALDSLDGQDAQLVDRALDAGDEYRETSFRLRDEIRAIEAKTRSSPRSRSGPSPSARSWRPWSAASRVPMPSCSTAPRKTPGSMSTTWTSAMPSWPTTCRPSGTEPENWPGA